MNDLKSDNQLSLSWHDSIRIPHLNATTILDYFSQGSNPFYDTQCNNEVIKMQRIDPERMITMTGKEYILLHCQEPILYVIRKQYRHSPGEVTPQADYYILAGYVYQAPDLNSVLNSRMLTTVHHLLAAFDETYSYMRYHPTKGYSWEFGKDRQADKSKEKEKEKEKAKEKAKEDFGSTFQRRRVDLLLGELAKKFPPKMPAPAASDQAKVAGASGSEEPGKSTAADGKVTEIKQEVITSSASTTSVATTSATGASSSSGTSGGGALGRNLEPPPSKKARLA